MASEIEDDGWITVYPSFERKMTLAEFEKVGWCPLDRMSDELFEACMKTGYIGRFLGPITITRAGEDE